MIYEGFRLSTVTLFGRIYWYGVNQDDQATSNYESQPALCEAIRTKQVVLSPCHQRGVRRLLYQACLSGGVKCFPS